MNSGIGKILCVFEHFEKYVEPYYITQVQKNARDSESRDCEYDFQIRDFTHIPPSMPLLGKI